MSTRQAGNPFFCLIFRLYIQTKFSKEQKIQAEVDEEIEVDDEIEVAM